MPELGQNYFTEESVIIATERAKRPEELARKRPAKGRASVCGSCGSLSLLCGQRKQNSARGHAVSGQRQ
jgi:galactose-1-phosphate uridylyltransferase